MSEPENNLPDPTRTDTRRQPDAPFDPPRSPSQGEPEVPAPAVPDLPDPTKTQTSGTPATFEG
jgi:hypothetical protein